MELVIVVVILAILAALLMPTARTPREAARRTQCKIHLKQIALALHNYHDEHGSFPPAYTVDAEGRRLHSWRTLLLPYLDQKALYERIDLTKPWDDPANAEAAGQPVFGFTCPSSTAGRDQTPYLAVVGEHNAFGGVTPRSLGGITNDHAKTLLLVEVDEAHSTHWMSPTDTDEATVLSLADSKRRQHAAGLHAANADGSVEFVAASTPAETLRPRLRITATRP